MSPAARRGLQVAKDLLRKKLLDTSSGVAIGGAGARRSDLDEAIQWIAHQEKLDDSRRKPRGLR